jgi:alanine dehydrogenase
MNVLVNCIYWDTPYPRLITKASIKSLYAGPKPPRLKVVGDISCDIEGSIEFTLKATEPDNPVFVYNPEKNTMEDGVAGNGPVVMSVDNLPCEISRESSEHFSKALLPFLPAIAEADYTVPFETLALPPEIKSAMLVHQGKFTPDYKFMEKFLK